VAAAVLWVVIHSWAGSPVTVNSIGKMVMFALPIAGIYAVQATGLVVVYSSTGIFNLAQGSIGMFGAFVYWTLLVQWHLPEALALFLAVCVFAPLFGLLLDVLIMRRLAQAALIAKLVATLGLSLALLGFANAIWNPNSPHAIPNLVATGGVTVFGVVLTWQRLITIGAALGLALALRWLLYRTRTGISMRAIVDNADLATLYGIRHARTSGLAWILGSVCATVASILIAPELGNLSAQTLSLLIIDSFAAAAVGRLRNLPLTYLGALLLGLVVSFSSTFLQFGGNWAQLPTAIPSIALLVVLLFLARGRHPVMMNKLRFDGFWANRPRDVSNLARFGSKELERPLNWQVVPITREQGGFLGSIRLCEEYANANRCVFLPRQFSNPANMDAHFRGTGQEILLQLGAIGLRPKSFPQQYCSTSLDWTTSRK